MMITPAEAAAILGISRRSIYGLAAPGGPIPCTRATVRRISFERSDVEEYKAKCQFTEIKRAAATNLNSTVLSVAADSGLESCFRRLGAEPRLTPSTAKSRPASTPRPAASSGRSTSSRKLSLVS